MSNIEKGISKEVNSHGPTQPDIESPLIAEQQKFKEAVEAGRWEDLTAESFPHIVAAQERPFYLNKLGMINEEMKRIAEDAPLMQDQKEALAILRGRIKELGKGASDTVKLLYPNVKPESETPLVTPEDLGKIEAYVQAGAIDELNSENIQGWDALSADQRLRFRLNAMQVYFSAWESIANDESLDEKEPVGFARLEEKDDTTPNIKNVHKAIEEKVVARHLKEWYDEAKSQGLEENNPMVEATKKLIQK